LLLNFYQELNFNPLNVFFLSFLFISYCIILAQLILFCTFYRLTSFLENFWAHVTRSSTELFCPFVHFRLHIKVTIRFARPKSHNLIVLFLPRRIFWDLISLCTIFDKCKKFKTYAISNAISYLLKKLLSLLFIYPSWTNAID